MRKEHLPALYVTPSFRHITNLRSIYKKSVRIVAPTDHLDLLEEKTEPK